MQISLQYYSQLSYSKFTKSYSILRVPYCRYLKSASTSLFTTTQFKNCEWSYIILYECDDNLGWRMQNGITHLWEPDRFLQL